MAFIAERQIEARASDLWRKYRLEPSFDVEALLDSLELSLLWDELPDNVLGALKADDSLVILNERRLPTFEVSIGLKRFTVGHEIGHSLFHADDARSGVLPMLTRGRTWCRNADRTPPEIQANLFASYLLMPTDRLQPMLPATKWHGWPTVYRLAEAFAVSATAMMVRLEKGGWAHRDDTSTPFPGRPPANRTLQPDLPLV